MSVLVAFAACGAAVPAQCNASFTCDKVSVIEVRSAPRMAAHDLELVVSINSCFDLYGIPTSSVNWRWITPTGTLLRSGGGELSGPRTYYPTQSRVIRIYKPRGNTTSVRLRSHLSALGPNPTACSATLDTSVVWPPNANGTIIGSWNPTGPQSIWLQGARDASSITMSIANALPNGVGVLALGAPGSQPLFGGMFYLNPATVLLDTQFADINGNVNAAYPIPPGLTGLLTWQAIFIDPSKPAGFALSNGCRI